MRGFSWFAVAVGVVLVASCGGKTGSLDDFDDGGVDGGVDAGTDASLPDASLPDAALPDAQCKGKCAATCAAPSVACTNPNGAPSCVDVRTDTANCGRCGMSCVPGDLCTGGTCASSCTPSQRACSPDGGAPYCANTQSDNSNCGSCGASCGPLQVCSLGTCASSCAAGQTLCTPAGAKPFCASELTDEANCGTCGHACASQEICTAGKCVATPSCPGGQTLCSPDGGTPYCASTQANDAANCGACGTKCGAQQTCVSGQCVGISTCPTAQTLCSPDAGAPYCASTQTDDANCGTCGTTCVAGHPCLQGVCSPCGTGLTSCGGTCADLTTARDHCGDCGKPCGPGLACARGACVPYKNIFVSSAQYTCNLGGLAGADAICQQLATAASLPGTYMAWLSDDTGTAAARLTHSTQPYALVDATTVAVDWTGLTSGMLVNPISMTETMGAPAVFTYCGPSVPTVWTDTIPAGTEDMPSPGFAVNYNCANWTGGFGGVGFGEASRKDTSWTSGCHGSSGIYSLTASLYCVQQ